jgi:hypothetical protein
VDVVSPEQVRQLALGVSDLSEAEARGALVRVTTAYVEALAALYEASPRAYSHHLMGRPLMQAVVEACEEVKPPTVRIVDLDPVVSP